MARTRHQRKAFGRLFRKLGNITNFINAADKPGFFKSWLAEILLKNNIEPVQPQILPLKHVRLQQLSDAGLNCPPFRYWLRGQLNLDELREFLNEHGSISLRNVTEERLFKETPKLPVEYDISDWDFISDYCTRHNRQHHTLVNKAYPLKDSFMAGNIILMDADKYIVSYFLGYGTPRDVDDKKSSELKVYLKSFGDKAPQWAHSGLADLIEKLRACHMQISPVVPKTFEFSIYPYPVGSLKSPEIFWEWRSGSAHDLYTIISRILERADSHELIFNMSYPGKPSNINFAGDRHDGYR